MRNLAYDFRSDTVTQPPPAMKEAMMAAPLGDDVFGEDPSALALEEKVAELTGFAAALFVPTGSMGNLTALMTHCSPGQVLYAGKTSHIKVYELGSYARLAGLNLPSDVLTKMYRTNALRILETASIHGRIARAGAPSRSRSDGVGE